MIPKTILYPLIILYTEWPVQSLKVVPERANVTYANENYVYDAKFYITRHGRRSAYYANVEGTIKHTWGNNISIHVMFYEYLHNEYRRTFIEWRFNYCDMMNKNQYYRRLVRHMKLNLRCPTSKGEYHFFNLTVPVDVVPPSISWPFEKGKMEVIIGRQDTGEQIVKAYALGTFSDEKTG